MRTNANPIMRNVVSSSYAGTGEEATYGGVVIKTSIFLLAFIISAMYLTPILLEIGGVVLIAALIGSIIGSLVFCLLALFVKSLTPVFGLCYSVCEGILIGLISMMYASMYDGIVILAVGSTVCVFVSMLFLYTSGIIKPGAKFRAVVITAFVGVILVSLGSFVAVSLNLMSFGTYYALYVAVVVVSCILAAMMLIIDFDEVRNAVDNGADKRSEWLLSFSLMVTIVYLYLRLLQLIAIIARK